MPPRSKLIDDADRMIVRLAREIGDALRTGRHIAGATQAQVGAAAGCSQSAISRRERGKVRSITLRQLGRHAAAVGLRLSLKLWPAGGAVRDAAQARYIAAFVARVGRLWRVTLEAVVPKPGDLRAADVLLVLGAVRIVVEVITRLTDLQAQIRAAQLKARDLEATRLVIVVASTSANRAAIADARATLAAAFDLDTRGVMASLAAGSDPGRDALILLAA
jgi:transcriptional regulator with XRE-family HTH domain